MMADHRFPALSRLVEDLPVWILVLPALLGVYLLITAYGSVSKERPLSGLPLVSIDGMSPLDSWRKKSGAVIKKGLEENDGPFQVLASTGPRVILPHRFATEIRNNPALTFSGAFRAEFFPDYPGFEGLAIFQGGVIEDLIQNTVRQKLSQSLQLITGDLVDEASFAISHLFGENKEWHPIIARGTVLDLIARVVSRVTLGKVLCRDDQWVYIAKNYTNDVFFGSMELKSIHPLLRPFMHWFKPRCTSARKEYKDAVKLISAELERRATLARQVLSSGKKLPKTVDTIGWMVELSKGRLKDADLTAAQLGLGQAAMLTTTEAMSQVLFRLVEFPELVQPLRDEVIQVLSEKGWSTNSLYSLEKMDSFFKECQRHDRPFAGMNRGAEKAIVLSDGTKIPKGTRLMVEAKHLEPTIFPEPNKFDAFRYVEKRKQPGQQNNWQYSSTSPEYFGFGLGIHSCPGRFFVSNNMKVMLCHLLLKYDWKLPDGEALKPWIESELSNITDPTAKLMFRRRQEEINLSALTIS